MLYPNHLFEGYKWLLVGSYSELIILDSGKLGERKLKKKKFRVLWKLSRQHLSRP